MIKQILRSLFIFVLITFSSKVFGQCPTISAGPNVSICASACTTLTATVTGLGSYNQTTSYSVAAIPYAPDPYTTGTAVVLGDDQWSNIIPLGFTFCFYGNSYTQFLIGSNGMVGFDPVAYPPLSYCQWPINAAVPNPAAPPNPRNCIMGPWMDIYPPAGGTIKYQLYGTAPCRRMVVSWYNVPIYSCLSPHSQQITMYETTNFIDDFIGNMPVCSWNGNHAIQAVHNAAGTISTFVPGRNYPSVWTGVTNDGQRFTPSGPPISPTISWYIGATLVGTGASLSACPTTTTVYTASVALGCSLQTISSNVTVTVTGAASANAGPDVTICSGGSTNLSASGGTSYTWTPATGLSCTTCPNPVATPTSTTTYVVTACTGSCCGNDTVVVTVAPFTSANAGLDDTICFGGSTVLNASGGTSYSWSPATGLSNPNISNPTATPTVTTTYTVTVTNAAGCSGTDQLTITVAPQLVLAVQGFAALCNAACNGQAVVIPSGGFSPYTYLWTPTGGTGPSATGLCAGTYTITVTDNIGCTAQDTAIVTQPAGMTLSTSSTPALCGTNNGSATVTASGGAGSYTYFWNPSAQTTATATGLSGTTYTVTVTDFNGCTATATVLVTAPPSVTASISTSANVTCNAGCNGSATVTVSTGTPPYTYAWSSGGTGATENNLCAGTYTVTVTDVNSCTTAVTVNITEPPLLTIAATATPNTICFGDQSTITATPGGGTPGYTIGWTPGPLSGPSNTVTPSANTTYTVTVTDLNGCTATNTVAIVVNPLPNPTFTLAPSPAQGCAPLCVTFTNTTSNSVNCNWAFGDGNTSTTCAGDSNCYILPGSYNVTLTVTDNNNCTASLTQNSIVTVYPDPVAEFTMNPQPTTTITPEIQFTDLSAGGAVNWLWNFGDPLNSTSTMQNPMFTYIDSGTYVVWELVTNVYGCVDSIMHMVRIDPDYEIFVPNAFTPNGDGYNDIFMPEGMYVDANDYTFMVFDRWGNMIFKTNKWGEGWNGKANGGKEIAQEDVYVWKVLTRDYTQTPHQYVGHVSLIK